MSGEVTGVVDWHGQNKFGGWSIKIGSNYYNSKFEIKCKKGDTVTFDSGPTGKYCNKLRVTSPGTGGGGSAPVQRRGGFPIGAEDGQRSIIRQNALARAAEVVALNPEGLESRDDIIVEMIRIASELERFSAGDLDAEAKEKLSAAA